MSAHWERITAFFDAARALDPPARSAFLDAACAGDADLRSEVERLLRDAQDDDGFLEPPWPGLLSGGGDQSIQPGDLLNPRYRVESPVASGGQAVVYRAVDTVLSRSVIVKVMRPIAETGSMLKRRFEHERQALARIDHPGVVGILDVGELPDGCPFLVIQLIN